VIIAALLAWSSQASASNLYKLYWWGYPTWYNRVSITFVGDSQENPDIPSGNVVNIRDITLRLGPYEGVVEPMGDGWTVSHRPGSTVGMDYPYLTEYQWASNLIISGYRELPTGPQYVEFSMLGDFREYAGILCLGTSGVYERGAGCFGGNRYHYAEWGLTDLGPIAAPVPEPATAWMLGAGTLGLLGWTALRRKRRTLPPQL
jgi:hypothetical protein